MVYKECRLSLNGKGKSCDLLGVGSLVTSAFVEKKKNRGKRGDAFSKVDAGLCTQSQGPVGHLRMETGEVTGNT